MFEQSRLEFGPERVGTSSARWEWLCGNFYFYKAEGIFLKIIRNDVCVFFQ
jgi:hypothetical protein